MVTATYIVKEAIEVQLPRAAHAGEATGTTLALVLTRDGDLYLDGVRVGEDVLRSRMREAVAKDREVRALISADKAALHGAVIHLIDLVKGEGISKFAINIEKEQ
jgi:biopolymer transport protein ExbD